MINFGLHYKKLQNLVQFCKKKIFCNCRIRTHALLQMAELQVRTRCVFRQIKLRNAKSRKHPNYVNKSLCHLEYSPYFQIDFTSLLKSTLCACRPCISTVAKNDKSPLLRVVIGFNHESSDAPLTIKVRFKSL